MANDFESVDSVEPQLEAGPQGRWLKFGLLVAASAFLGGMGAAWWYRKTLIRMRQADEIRKNPQFGIPDENPPDEI